MRPLVSIILLSVSLMLATGCHRDQDKPGSASNRTDGALASDAVTPGYLDAAPGDGGMDSGAAPVPGDSVDSGNGPANTDATLHSDLGGRCIVLDDPNLCISAPPHNDSVGMVCANDGTPAEAYCMETDSGTMVCARHVEGGPCEGGTPAQDVGVPQGSDARMGMPQTVQLQVRDLEPQDPLARFFQKRVVVFGVPLVSAAGVPAAKLIHAGTIMAEYLDNDEDGLPDDPAVIASMVRNRAILVMFPSSRALEASGIFESPVLREFWAQDLQGDETLVPGRFDASLEEVLHLISTAGYGQVYPDALGEGPGTRLTDAMDLARGGHFLQVPAQYPDDAWYHYDDRTCEYRCMATEYFYWGLTTRLGGQSDPQRCLEIAVEWEICTPDDLAVRDRALHQLLTDPQYRLPTILPDGIYNPMP